MNLPNLISLARFLCVPAVVLLILFGRYGEAFWLFTIAALSDAVDGFIAKQFNMATQIGAYLDPIADKSLLVGVYIALTHQGTVPIWLMILVGFRDLAIVGGVLLMQALQPNGRRIEPMFISKVNTFAQLLLASVALLVLGYGFDDHGVVGVLIYVVAFTTVTSGIGYLARLLRGGRDLERVG